MAKDITDKSNITYKKDTLTKSKDKITHKKNICKTHDKIPIYNLQKEVRKDNRI